MENIIMSRRCIRKFEDRAVEREKLEKIVRGAMQSPTAKNTQCWEFLVVTEPESCAAVSKMSPFAMCAEKAPALVIPMVNFDRVDSADCWWVEDLAAATMTVIYMAESLGLGACWLGMYPLQERTDKLREYFDLPENIMPFAVVPVGYKQRVKEPEDRFDAAKLHWERF